MDDLRDDRNRRLKVGVRVRGMMRSGIEVHGLVLRIWEHEKHGPVLVIDDGKYEQNVPASQCRRMYGHTNQTRELAEVERAVAERKATAEPPKRRRAHPKRKL